tara:strand:- start:4429 stop:5730 length:1302 start_codon:yes stop_codon:yes gene_type:complete
LKEINIYVFDLDNTLCQTDGSNYLKASPFIERIKEVNKLYDDGNTIIIETARGCISGKNWFYLTVDQLKSWGLKFHTLRTGVKFNGDIFVDDRGINSEDFFSDGKNLNKESGSGVDTNVVIVSRVVKEATNERIEKLVDEIKFIESVPEKFKDKFPEIVFSKYDNKKAFYEMKHYDLPTIRRLILSGQMDSDEIVKWSDKITRFSMEMYSHEKLDISNQEYFDVLHWKRFENRIQELSSKSEWFKEILSQEDISINGEQYKNLPFLYEKIKSRQKWFNPEFIGRWSHSDLHFSNILIDKANEDFRLIDPRGYDFCDYYYDFGKLWHSVNGKYELIASRMFKVSEPNEGHWFSLDQGKPYFALENSKNRVMDIFVNVSGENRDQVEIKTEFNDVMHFATLIPFLLVYDSKEEKARTAYYQSVILTNNFCKKYGV